MAATSNEERLARLLALVPYLQARPGIEVQQAAADFGVSEAQLRKDLTLLWMCGLPGHGPGDLIDLSFEGETVSVIFDAGMSRPLRLTAEEALALERPAMTYVRAQLGDRLGRQLGRAYQRWRHPSSGRRAGDRFL
jgi:predicted DNA-binding transcriptional regulator YafY